MTPLFAWLFDTLDERLGLRSPSRKAANKVFPHNWSFLLGEIALFALVVLVLTGVFLTMFYRPSIEAVTYNGSFELYRGTTQPAAFESILRLSHDIPGGLLFRRIHRVAAHLFVAAGVLHMLRILLTGAFRRPREVNYLVGIGLITFAFAAGFTGYSLPYDSLAGTGIRIAYSELLSFPVVGDSIAFWVFGGDFPTGDVIPRFFVFHVMVLPAIIIGTLTIHLLLVVRQRHTQFPARGVDGHRFVLGKPLWPAQFAESATLMLWVGGVLALASILVPWSDITLIGPYVPGEVGNNAQPDWYMFWVEGALRIFPAVEFSVFNLMTISGPFIAGILLPGLVFTGLALYPFIERRVCRLEGEWHVLTNPLEIPLRAAFVVGTFGFVLIISAAATNDILSRLTGVPIEAATWFFRITAVVVPPLAAAAVYVYSTRRLRRRGRTVATNEQDAMRPYLFSAGSSDDESMARSGSEPEPEPE
ncbi:MAG: ubiquinol-cytochrome c reductase cytochrome b subunit [Nitriliruptorales bacterium]|nr:ubiquinol-cytochrome c reductase cytochrome b subunit [Nitriliruptorales bacterium]